MGRTLEALGTSERLEARRQTELQSQLLDAQLRTNVLLTELLIQLQNK